MKPLLQMRSLDPLATKNGPPRRTLHVEWVTTRAALTTNGVALFFMPGHMHPLGDLAQSELLNTVIVRVGDEQRAAGHGQGMGQVEVVVPAPRRSERRQLGREIR